MTSSATAPLPYGPILRRVLRPVQRGFLVVNGWFVRPMLRSPLGRLVGNPATGHILLLRTRGRRTGLVREAPLGYVILDGFVYSVAGYGVATPWYRNLLDNPTVEVVLPGRTIRGIAEPVTDDAEWLRAYRALIGSFGLVGRLVDGDPRRLPDRELIATHRSLPVVRIRSLDPAGPVIAGPWDRGGHGWLVGYGTLAAVLIVAAAFRWTRAGSTPTGPRRQGPPRPSG
ncbi:MAG: nitroreductase family deazaflavin-dependent oxidoreductase [Chloroflexi bacterium]|nr:nitroreductase family deazaflavin-dependent oxidoreductase [Chloroflexota bacterium]